MIVSTTNSKVKRLTALTHKAKARRDEGVFVAEGIKNVSGSTGGMDTGDLCFRNIS